METKSMMAKTIFKSEIQFGRVDTDIFVTIQVQQHFPEEQVLLLNHQSCSNQFKEVKKGVINFKVYF